MIKKISIIGRRGQPPKKFNKFIKNLIIKNKFKILLFF